MPSMYIRSRRSRDAARIICGCQEEAYKRVQQVDMPESCAILLPSHPIQNPAKYASHEAHSAAFEWFKMVQVRFAARSHDADLTRLVQVRQATSHVLDATVAGLYIRCPWQPA